jgi:hypothetical protein
MKNNKLFILHYREARSLGVSSFVAYKCAKAFINSLYLVA